MKNRNIKRLRATVILLLLLLVFPKAKAELIIRTYARNNSPSRDYVIEYFKVIDVDNKLYFKFLIIEHQENAAYILESSFNGLDFNAVQIKEGSKSPNGIPLLYCYTEKLKDNENISYRIKRVSLSGIDISNSCTLEMTNLHNSKKWTSCINENFNGELADLGEDYSRNILLATQGENYLKINERSDIDNTDAKLAVAIYATPDKEELTVKLGQLKDASIKIFNINGKLVFYQGNINDSIKQIEFHENIGVYFVEINAHNQTERFTIVKK